MFKKGFNETFTKDLKSMKIMQREDKSGAVIGHML